MNILVTGSRGFVGRNLMTHLKGRCDLTLYEYDLDNEATVLEEALQRVDIIFHLAGVNRPETEDEFYKGNTEFTEEICRMLIKKGRRPKIVLSSSIQAELDNFYGISKRKAEEALERYSKATAAESVIYRFKNLFGKWCRPNYNSVTATFCHNIAKELPIQISNPANMLELTYIDDVIKALMAEIDTAKAGFHFANELPSTQVTLGELAEKIQQFKKMRTTLQLPDFSDSFDRNLYATFLTYFDGGDFAYHLDIKADQRGSLAEFIKSPAMGQIFISHTRPGVTRGDHYHHTKAEKFMVVQGEAVIRFRRIESDKIIEYLVRGEDYRVLDIPPGYTHSIKNVGQDELVMLFWASEIFDPDRPDTFYDPVIKDC